MTMTMVMLMMMMMMLMSSDSWALHYLRPKWASSTYVITMPNIGLYIRLMPLKWMKYVIKS